MTKSRIGRIFGGIALTAMFTGTLSGLSGCEDPPPPPAPRPTPPPPPPPPPEPVNIDRLVASLDVDARVQFPQDYAPTDRALAESFLLFTSAMVTKDSEAMRPLMSAAGREVLSQVEQGWWGSEVDTVRVVMMSPGGGGMPRDGAFSAGGAGGPVPQAAMDLLMEIGPLVLQHAPDELRSQIPAEDLAMLTDGSWLDTAMAEVPGGELTSEMLMMGITLIKPMLDQIASGNVDGLGEQVAGMMSAFAPPGMDMGDMNFDMDAETQQQMEQMQPLASALSTHLDKILAALNGGDSESDNVETSSSSATFVTAMHDPSIGAYVLMWDAQRFNDGWFFTPLAATDEIRQSVHDWDGGSLNDYRVNLVSSPIVPDFPDLPSADDSGSGGSGRGDSISGG